MKKKYTIVTIVIIVSLLIIFIFKHINNQKNAAQLASDKKKLISPIPSPTKKLIPTITSTPTPTPTPTITPTPTLIPTIMAPQQLEEFFIKYSSDYNIDKELLKRIAHCESTFNPSAKTSLYAGLYQFSESLWIQTRNLMGLNTDLNLRFNAEESIRTAAFLISQGNLGVWPSCIK